MNDPHVEALLYDFIPEPFVDYSEAEPLNHEEMAFDLSVVDGVARFKLNEHFATEAEARLAVDPFIEQWRAFARLQPAPRSFELKFRRSVIVDRNPTPGVPPLRMSARSGTPTTSIRLTVGDRKYPAAPYAGMKMTLDVQSMYDRFVGHLEGKEPLPSMAYFCPEILQGATGASRRRRPEAARAYRIDEKVLDKIGCLASRKGGAQARKWEGRGAELNASEVQFLKRAVGAIILRMAQMAADPERDFPTIRTSDL